MFIWHHIWYKIKQITITIEERDEIFLVSSKFFDRKCLALVKPTGQFLHILGTLSYLERS